MHISKLIQHFGQKKTFAHINKILSLHKDTYEFIRASCVDDGIQSGTTLQPFRRAEIQLYQRLTLLNQKHSMDLTIHDTSAIPRSGDVICCNQHGVKSIWDSKLYARKVPWTQVQKLARDVRIQEASFGVIVSTHGVSRIKNTHICDGIPIHAIRADTHMELACLYLTMATTPNTQNNVICNAKHAHEQQLIRSIHELTTKLIASTT